MKHINKMRKGITVRGSAMNNNFILMVSLTTAFCRLPAQQVYELDFQKCLAIAQNKCPDIQVLDENTAVPLKKM